MIVVALTTVVVNYSLLVQASRIFVIFTMLAAVLRIYTTRTNGTSITRFANIRAAAGQNARI